MKNKINKFLVEYKENGVPLFSTEGCYHISQAPTLPLYTCAKCGKQGATLFQNDDYFNPNGFFHLLKICKNSDWYVNNPNPNVKCFADVIGNYACRDFNSECVDYEMFPIILATYLGMNI